MEKQRETCRFVAFPRQYHLDVGLIAEKRAFDIGLSRYAEIGESLELGKPLNHFQNRRHVRAGCGRQTQLVHVLSPRLTFMDRNPNSRRSGSRSPPYEVGPTPKLAP